MGTPNWKIIGPELLEYVKQLERVIVYEISRHDKRDDEGLRLKTINLNLVRDVIDRANGY